jgi:TRAP-type C4-dicarboxylate transport system substrate-binding protein
LSKLKGEVKKAKLVESLSPDIRKVVTKLLGEGTETEIVERFATIKQALKEEKVMAPSAPVVESKTRVSAQEESADINEDIYDETDFIQPTVRDDVYEPVTVSETREEKEFAAQLQEQLVLSGLRKK